MMDRAEQRVTFESDGLILEGMLLDGQDDGALAVVMHPHPLYGGDLDSAVVMELCAALRAAGATTLRFNFRGAGRSQGAFDGGRGERDDALAAAALLRERRPAAPVIVAGYSFGATIAAAVAAELAPRALVLVSPPVARMELPPLPEGLATLLIAGDRDPYAPPDRMAAATGSTVVVVPGVDHFWSGGMSALNAEVAAFVRAALLTEFARSSA